MSGDLFGAALTAGDFDADGHQDLVIGAPLEDLGPLVDAGAVTVVYGSGSGLVANSSEFWTQDSTNVKGVAEQDDQLGGWLASGDFAGIGVSFLAIGVPLEDLGPNANAGTVHILKGAGGIGVVATGDQRWDQGSAGVPNAIHAGDRFGRLGSVASG